MTTLRFSAMTDDGGRDLLLFTSDTPATLLTILDEGTNSKQLAELPASEYRGWLIDPDVGPPFAVYAFLLDGAWLFSIGFPPADDGPQNLDLGNIKSYTALSQECAWSTEFTVRMGCGVRVSAIEGTAAGL